MNLQRFIDAQEHSYQSALEEIQNGRKTSHWIWYIFPQLKELGQSQTARFYGIDGKAEALSYMENELLHKRLIEITDALLAIPDKNIKDILGYPDYLKVKSCMTLFATVAPHEKIFKQVLEKYYKGRMDEKTLILLDESKELFSGKAGNYEVSRPTYPNETIEYILNLAPEQAQFADIGAGTGKLTTLIARRGEQIIAVEPNADMRKELSKNLENYPNALISQASAEDTKIASNSIDIILVAQALHWFELSAFKKEVKRIAKSDALIFVLYNDEESEKVSHRSSATEEFFSQAKMETFSNPVFYTKDKWLAYKTSHSHDPKPKDANYQSHIEAASQLFEENSTNDILKREFVTTIYWQKVSDL